MIGSCSRRIYLLLTKTSGALEKYRRGLELASQQNGWAFISEIGFRWKTNEHSTMSIVSEDLGSALVFKKLTTLHIRMYRSFSQFKKHIFCLVFLVTYRHLEYLCVCQTLSFQRL